MDKLSFGDPHATSLDSENEALRQFDSSTWATNNMRNLNHSCDRGERDSRPVPFPLRNEFPFPSQTREIDMKNNGNEK